MTDSEEAMSADNDEQFSKVLVIFLIFIYINIK